MTPSIDERNHATNFLIGFDRTPFAALCRKVGLDNILTSRDSFLVLKKPHYWRSHDSNNDRRTTVCNGTQGTGTRSLSFDFLLFFFVDKWDGIQSHFHSVANQNLIWAFFAKLIIMELAGEESFAIEMWLANEIDNLFGFWWFVDIYPHDRCFDVGCVTAQCALKMGGSLYVIVVGVYSLGRQDLGIPRLLQHVT